MLPGGPTWTYITRRCRRLKLEPRGPGDREGRHRGTGGRRGASQSEEGRGSGGRERATPQPCELSSRALIRPWRQHTPASGVPATQPRPETGRGRHCPCCQEGSPPRRVTATAVYGALRPTLQGRVGAATTHGSPCSSSLEAGAVFSPISQKTQRLREGRPLS